MCVCVIFPYTLISKYFCGWFSNPWILVTIYGMGGVVIKGMGAVAWDCSIPEVRNKNFPLIPLTIYLAGKANLGSKCLQMLHETSVAFLYL